MSVNPGVGMTNMNPMGVPVGGAPMPMMNNGVVNPQAPVNPAAAARQQQQQGDNHRSALNTYIYEYFLRHGMYDCAKSLLNSDVPIHLNKDERRRDENGNIINGAGESMETDSKDDLDNKIPDDLPPPRLPMPSADTSFLYEWFCLFWDIFNAQRAKGNNASINQYIAHTQQQDMLRSMRPDMQQYQMMRNMQNGGMGMMKQGGGNQLARAAIANNQNNPQMQMLQQQAKQNQMQRDPSGMDANRDRPSSPAQGDNAPSPSKRQRVDGANFNPNQAVGMMPNGRPGQMPSQMANNPNAAAAHQMLTANGINPSSLNAQQLQSFVNATPNSQQKSIATYAQHLQQHHGNQMGGKPGMPGAGPQGQGSPMMPQGPDGTALNAFYNPGEIGGPGGLRPGPNGQQAAGSNHALQDYQMQLMLLEQQNKKRLMMARQEQDNLGGMPREGQAPGQPGGPGQLPTGPNGQPFPESSPQGMRTGTSPNPSEQMKRGTPQMNNSGIPSPMAEGGQSRGSPSSMNFMAGGQADPNMGPPFNMNAQGQMAGMRPPSSHPGQPFNGQMNPQQMMAARQHQQQAGQGNPQQWQQGPNGQMLPQGMQGGGQQVQGTPQQQNRSMPPPSAPAAAGANVNNRTTASPQQTAAAPPTPNQGSKAAPKKKETKSAKEKRAAGKKAAQQNNNSNNNSNNNAASATDNNSNADGAEAPTPQNPITPANSASFGKGGQNGAASSNAPTTQGASTAAPVAPAGQGQGANDPSNGMSMDNFGGMFDVGPMELNNPLQSNDVLNDFDFDSFLHDDNGGAEQFDFNAFGGIEGGEIGAD